jgi:hypothetical protein
MPGIIPGIIPGFFFEFDPLTLDNEVDYVERLIVTGT